MGKGGICAANEYSCAHGAQIKFGDPTPFNSKEAIPPANVAWLAGTPGCMGIDSWAP